MPEAEATVKPAEEGPFIRIERIEETGKLTKKDVNFFIELGIAELPKAEKGTELVPGGEKENLKYRKKYIKDNLGIDIESTPKPISKRLVANVIFDLITMCQTIAHELEAGENPDVFIDNFNAEIYARKTKGNLKVRQLKSGRTARAAGLEWQHSPLRSDDYILPGYYKAILQEIYMALERKKGTTR